MDARIEIYRQCFEQRKHYDLLSWTVAAIILATDGFLIRWSLDHAAHDIFAEQLAVNTIGLLLVICWHSIYERNRMFVEVANELARDIARDWQLEGVGIRNARYATNKAHQVEFKNLDENGEAFASPFIERQKTWSSHFGIRGLMFAVAAIHFLLIAKQLL
jgi:hypothetical protein